MFVEHTSRSIFVVFVARELIENAFHYLANLLIIFLWTTERRRLKNKRWQSVRAMYRSLFSTLYVWLYVTTGREYVVKTTK